MILALRSSLPQDVGEGKDPTPSIWEGEGTSGVDKYRRKGGQVESEDTRVKSLFNKVNQAHASRANQGQSQSLVDFTNNHRWWFSILDNHEWYSEFEQSGKIISNPNMCVYISSTNYRNPHAVLCKSCIGGGKWDRSEWKQRARLSEHSGKRSKT